MELKFRAWHKRTKKYYKVISLNFDCDYVTLVDENNIKMILYFNEVIIEQYTGLKDKNGKDIYEGDIVMTESEKYIKLWYVIFNYHGEFILFNGLNSNLRFNEIELTVINNGYVSDIEIIGNIHENKYLIEEGM